MGPRSLEADLGVEGHKGRTVMILDDLGRTVRGVKAFGGASAPTPPPPCPGHGAAES